MEDFLRIYMMPMMGLIIGLIGFWFLVIIAVIFVPRIPEVGKGSVKWILLSALLVTVVIVFYGILGGVHSTATNFTPRGVIDRSGIKR